MYIPLYNKTTYTFLSSLLEVDDLIQIALDNNLKSIAICDDNMFGVMEFITKCQDNNLNPIVGLDLNDRLLFAKNYLGYQNLLKLTSLKTEKELTEEDYDTYKDNIICIPLKNIETKYETFFYSNKIDNYEEENKIYLNKLLYKEKLDYETLKYLELLRDNLTILNEYEEKKDCYFKEVNIDDLSLQNTFKLASLCHLELPKFSLNFPSFMVNTNSNDYLISLAYKGINKRLNDNVPLKYLERLKYELDVIIKMGFTDYFLIVYDFIKYAKTNNILVGPGRGSAAGSLVSFSLGITDIDPLRYDLLFERFLNPERISMPDIDTDFPDIYRDDVIKYVNQKYGNKHVANIITFLQMGAKLCIRDIGRVMNIPLVEVDNITKTIGSRKESLKELLKTDIKLQSYMQKDNKIKKLMEISSKVEGIKRHTSIHAAGIIIAGTPLDNYVPLVYDESTNQYLSGYEAAYLENLGLLKMDFLGIRNLTTIMEIIEQVSNQEQIKIDFNNIPLDDEKTIELFKQGDTSGIFQFESLGMKQFLAYLKPNNFEEIASAIALYRPASASSIPEFIKRKETHEGINYFHKDLEPILKSTYGIIVYQEQTMQIVRTMAGFTLGEADILRRAISKKKKDLLDNLKDKFIEGSINNGYSKELSEEIYDLILKFASYGFNKSHSIAYTMVAYKMAYLKVHFGKYFYNSLLNSVIGDTNKTKEYLYELKKYNIKILKPDLNLSNCSYQVIDNHILSPFNIIKGISKVICNKIIENRKESYQDIYDFFSKNNTLTRNNLEILIEAGCLDTFGYNRNTLLNNLDNLINYTILCKDLEKEYVLKPEIIIENEFDNNYLIEKEKELYGFYISNHPVLTYKSKYDNIINLRDIEKYFNKMGNFIVLVEKTKVIETKKQDKMMFLSGSDEEVIGDFTLFPNEYNKYFSLKKGDIIKVYGKIEKRNGAYQIIVKTIDILN